MRFRFAIALVLLLGASAASGQDFLSFKGPVKGLEIEQKLDAQLPLDLVFRDEAGRQVRLGDYFQKGRPVVINLVYFSCPMLCNVVLDGLTASIADIKMQPGKDYELLTISFDHRDTPKLAAEKKGIYARRYGRRGADEGWHFLTTDEETVRKITSSLGFRYAWDPKAQQFAHGTMTAVITPEGKVSRYLFGIDNPSRDLRLAIVEASDGKIGSPADQLLLLCYHYDPASGTYSKHAMNFVRAGGVATVVALAGFIFFLSRRPSDTETGA
jgi:protein SCO1/2